MEAARRKVVRRCGWRIVFVFCLRARKVWWCAVVDNGCGSRFGISERAHAGAVGFAQLREIVRLRWCMFDDEEERFARGRLFCVRPL